MELAWTPSALSFSVRVIIKSYRERRKSGAICPT
jgi:hypothetical protein